MIFNSLTFVVFFVVVLGMYYLPISWRAKKLNLLVASYIFYGAWNPPFLLLLWITTIIDWFAAKGMDAFPGMRARRAFLVLSLVANLGLLGFFKYGDFLSASFGAALGALGVGYRPPRLDIILPIGISFYTFQSLTYTIDVYLGKLKAWSSFLDYALYVTFFPQLVAGPIVRAAHFLPQCATPRRASRDQLGWGLNLLVIGLFEKIVLADTLMAPIADSVYDSAKLPGMLDAWTGTLAFSAQIFFDFAGYSTCAIGAALCLGFGLNDNFRFPYAAIGFSDFWRRWHVSLSTWLRDYLYVPLGGNRKGNRRTYVNLLLTMLLGGLWHGASWRFVAWGGLHGTYLSAERYLRNAAAGRAVLSRFFASPLAMFGMSLVTYSLVCFTWVFFRAKDFPSAFTLLSAMTTGGAPSSVVSASRMGVVAVVTASMLASHWLLRDSSLEETWQRSPIWMRVFIMATLLFLIALAPGDDRAFIYFQF